MIVARPLPVLVGEVSATFLRSIAKVLGLTRHYLWVCLRAGLCICFVCPSVRASNFLGRFLLKQILTMNLAMVVNHITP